MTAEQPTVSAALRALQVAATQRKVAIEGPFPAFADASERLRDAQFAANAEQPLAVSGAMEAGAVDAQEQLRHRQPAPELPESLLWEP